MRTLAIIQARMGSSRMPGKVLKLVAGKPVLWHVIHRLRQCREIDDVVIATTTHASDDPLIDFARDQHTLITRGPEDNVLERYLLAIQTYDADLIVRVTGDAPLVDPQLIDTMLAAIKHEHADICHGHLHNAPQDAKVIHEGFTAISRRALEQLSRHGGHDPAVREHVTVKIQDYVENLKRSKDFSNDEYLKKETQADKLGDFFAEYLGAIGYSAVSQSERNIELIGCYDPISKSSTLPHKTIALLAGLGWIGKNNLLVTETFGSAICMCTILTNAPIKTVSFSPQTSRCEKCAICQGICPTKALSGRPWSPEENRDDILNVSKCNTCLKCMIHCPWTQKYMRSA